MVYNSSKPVTCTYIFVTSRFTWQRRNTESHTQILYVKNTLSLEILNVCISATVLRSAPWMYSMLVFGSEFWDYWHTVHDSSEPRSLSFTYQNWSSLDLPTWTFLFSLLSPCLLKADDACTDDSLFFCSPTSFMPSLFCVMWDVLCLSVCFNSRILFVLLHQLCTKRES